MLAALPACVIAACAAPPPGALRVATHNLAHGRGLSASQFGLSRETFETNLDAIAAVIKREQPDVLALQEADAPSSWSGSFDHVQRLVTQTGYPHVYHGHHFDTGGFGVKLKYGTAVLARRELETPTSHRFTTPPWHTKGFVTAEVEFEGRSLLVVSIHLDSTSAAIRRRHVQKVCSELEKCDKPVVLMGDLNSRWRNERDAVRLLVSRLNLRAFDPQRAGLETYSTDALRRRIDWILISPELEFVDYRVWPDQLSDHLAVAAELRWRD